MKKKVGILTLCGNDNFGNKLQNYATVQTVTNLKISVSTIWVENAFLAPKIKHFLKYMRRLYYDYVKYHNRRNYFLGFNTYLNIQEHLFFNNDFEKIASKYDAFLVGSDQVWNYNYFTNDSYYLLDKSKCKNIAFSASFGVSDIPKQFHDRYKKGLSNFDYISVREDRGKEIVEELTGRKDVEVLVDPTMLLTSYEWDKVSKMPKQMKNKVGKKYILNYFLGELSDSRRKEIEKIAKENDCYIINILDKNDPFYCSGPSEFLYLEKNAFLVCTDSFHSCVFALLYDRPFVIFDREQKGVESMSSRLDTLISKFKLKNRRYNGKEITKENLEHDYSEAYKILEKERKKSKEFLEKALEIK